MDIGELSASCSQKPELTELGIEPGLNICNILEDIAESIFRKEEVETIALFASSGFYRIKLLGPPTSMC